MLKYSRNFISKHSFLIQFVHNKYILFLCEISGTTFGVAINIHNNGSYFCILHLSFRDGSYLISSLILHVIYRNPDWHPIIAHGGVSEYLVMVLMHNYIKIQIFHFQSSTILFIMICYSRKCHSLHNNCKNMGSD